MKLDRGVVISTLTITMLACSLAGALTNRSTPQVPAAASPERTLQSVPSVPQTLDLEQLILTAAGEGLLVQTLRFTYDGQDRTGQPMIIESEFEVHYQTVPETALLTRTTGRQGGDEEIFETIYIAGNEYFIDIDGQCTVSPMADTLDVNLLSFDLEGGLKGQASLTEAGVHINGVLTDRYELSSDNLNWQALQTGELLELKSASLYRARQGGYLSRLVLVALARGAVEGFDPAQPYVITLEFDQTLSTATVSGIHVPDACQGLAP